MSALNRTGRHNHMRPVVRPLPRPGVALSAATTSGSSAAPVRECRAHIR